MADPVARAHRAAQELEQTNEAFAAVREGVVKKLLDAHDPDEAFKGVLQVRALDEVQSTLQRVIDAGRVEEQFPSD